MVSFTGSTAAGSAVAAAAAAPTVKRVAQELGGKSANIVLDDADLAEAVAAGAWQHVHQLRAVVQRADAHAGPRGRARRGRRGGRRTAEDVVVGDPRPSRRGSAPWSAVQYDRIQQLIERGMAEGATVVAGGPGAGWPGDGYYVRPTVFADVTQRHDDRPRGDLRSGAVMIPLRDDDDAVRIANDTTYGLSGYVSVSDERAAAHRPAASAAARCTSTARRPTQRPFGGYKQSGNGREWGRFGIEEYLETKAVMGWEPQAR